MPKIPPDVLRVLAEKLYCIDQLQVYLRSTVEINKEMIKKIIKRNEQCKMTIAYFPMNAIIYIDDIIDILILIAHTERVFMPSQNGKQ